MITGETAEFIAVGSSADLVEGEMRAVQVNGKRVLLALVEGVPYALGATCTHERANLDEGALMGYQVYCPLHFSCFDLRTGEALAPPADRATPVYAVKIEGDTVYVSASPGDPEQAPALIAPPDAAPTDVVPPRAASRHERLLGHAEELPGLERGAEALGTALRPIREGRLGGRLFDLLHGRMMGHALHPALSDLPIGLWTGALLLDVLGETDAALILGVAGIATAVATAITGVADWTVSDGRDRRLGLLHGILQTVALAIIVGAVVLRTLDLLLVGQILTAAGLALSLASAYLGGHLVLGRGVMVDHTAWTRGPRSWTRAIELSELAEGQAKPAPVEGRQVLISMTEGVVSAIEDACTHAGGPLSMGHFENGVVRCPWHGSCFRLRDGAVVKGPATHPQPMLEARVRDGWVEVRGLGRW
jgi:nitrite reductase/ring-hydroxylating ferredoxin subunit/uncharacterized membrane protein